MILQYYSEIHDVLQKRLDECSVIIEEYYIHKVNEYKEQMILSSPSTDGGMKEITDITNEHHDQLKHLRLLYDDFLKNAEIEFFDVLKQIRFPMNSQQEEVETPKQPKIVEPRAYFADREESDRSTSAINIETSQNMTSDNEYPS